MKLGPHKDRLNLKNCIQHVRWKYPSTQQFSKRGMKAYVGHYLEWYKITQPLPHTMARFTAYLEKTIDAKARLAEEEEANKIEPNSRQILDPSKP